MPQRRKQRAVGSNALLQIDDGDGLAGASRHWSPFGPLT